MLFGNPNLEKEKLCKYMCIFFFTFVITATTTTNDKNNDKEPKVTAFM